jgi:DNA-binding transcriptional LysR family regulator
MPKTTVSQKVAKLEEQLGVQACGTGLVNDDVVVLRRAAERGFGIARLTTVIVCEAIREGALVPILERDVPTPTPVHIVQAGGGQMPPRTRPFLDFVQPRVDQALVDVSAAALLQ